MKLCDRKKKSPFIRPQYSQFLFLCYSTFNCEAEEPIKLKKHKVIAQAFAKRKTFNNAGRLSISFHNTHEDPVGLNFDLNSVASQDFSSTWAAALPKLVTRRGALVGVTTGSVSSNRRNSVDSEISFSVRRFSVESRRNSLDSQISVQIAELKTRTRKVASSTLPGNSRRRKDKRRRREFGKTRSGKVGPLFRRGSTTSQESQLGAQILSALTIGGNPNVPSLPNMKRRSASAGLDGQIINSKILDGKNAGMLLPFLFPGQSESDENLSSEEKGRGGISRKDADVEAGIVDKDEQDSESEDSHAEEDTKMLNVEEPPERSRSKTSNKSAKSYGHDSGRRSKEIKVKNMEIEMKDMYSYCPELSRLMQSEDSKAKPIKRQNDDANNQSSAREMATQTSLPLDILEMEELKQSIDEIINSRNCSSKGTQISPQLNKTTNRKSSDIR